MKKSGSIWGVPPNTEDDPPDRDVSLMNAEMYARDRNSKTLSLRTVTRPSIAKVFGKLPSAPLIDTVNFPYLDPDFAVQTLESDNIPKIIEFLHHILETTQDTPRLLNAIAKSATALAAFGACLNPSLPDNVNILIIAAITAIFPYCGELSNEIIDAGLFFSISTFISESSSAELLVSSLDIIRYTSSTSAYARNAAFCLDIPILLIEVAKNSPPEISDRACETIRDMFNPEGIDQDRLPELIVPIAQLLELPSKTAVAAILGTLVAITNQSPVLVFTLHSMSLFPGVVSLLGDEDLQGVALKLVGNMAVSQAAQVKELLDNGLFEALMALIGTVYTSDCFWVLSNLFESSMTLMQPYFGPAFVEEVFKTAYGSPYEVKKEAAFFLATLVVFSETTSQVTLLREDVIDLLIDMLDCGCPNSIIRYVDAILVLIHLLPTIGDPAEAAAFFVDSDLREKLNNLQEEPFDKRLMERVTALIAILDRLEGQD